MTKHLPTVQLVRTLAADPEGPSDRDLLARFAAHRDQAAFAAVAARHTRLVLGVCRRALRRAADAEDACQAVFLLLAQKAGGIRWQHSVAGWLYTVARRVARNARVAAERRARRESKAAVPEATSPVDSMTGRELTAVLDEELGRLPPRYRDPLIQCCLEGLTQDEAAARLGIGIETLRSQLKRGRKLLADALSARGYELGIALLAVAASGATAAPRLVTSIQAAAAGTPSSAAIHLARGAIVNTVFTPARSIVLVAALGAAALGLAAVLTPPTSAQPPKDRSKPPVKTVETPVGRFGSTRFQANAPVGDAGYCLDGKRVVGYAGRTLYVWDADGSGLRTMDTKLEPLPDVEWPPECDRAFAVHPTKSLVAIGGMRRDKVILQVWDFESGKRIAEEESRCARLWTLAWTPDGGRLLERSGELIEKKLPGKLIVRDGTLKEVRSHEIPKSQYPDRALLAYPLPGSKEVVLWQSGADPTVYDLDTGRLVRTIPYRTSAVPSGLCLSTDGKTMIFTCSELVFLVDSTTGETRHRHPLRRGGAWYRPRPLFSPDGQTVYVWDRRPIAYDVATGKEKWAGVFPTVHNYAMRLCDVSADGSTVLCRHGHRLARINAATGTERDPLDGPSGPAGITWSPDGRLLLARAHGHERTWTAWDAATGKRLYDLQPAGFVSNNTWKLMPDLYFIRGGQEIVAGLELAEGPTEQVGLKELLVFDAATGKCLRRLGEPLPKGRFQQAHPIAVDPDGSAVVIQVDSATRLVGPLGGGGGPGQLDTSREPTFRTTRWDPVRQTIIREWEVTGNRADAPRPPTSNNGTGLAPRHYAPYSVTVGVEQPEWNNNTKKLAPARVRCYSLADGRLMHEWATGFAGIDVDRVQGNYLMSTGFERQFVGLSPNLRFLPKAPFAYDVWELSSGQGVRVFELDRQAPAALGPGGQYVLKARDDGTVEVHEPFVLKRSVATVTAPAAPAAFEFAPDRRRVAVSLADTSIAVWDTAPWVTRINEELTKAVPPDLTPLWDDLAADAPTALRAARLLGAAGDKAIALLKRKLSARQPPDAARVARLIADLDSAKFADRKKAEADLRDLSTQAEPFLRRALQAGPSAEARKRIESLLGGIAANKLPAGQLRELRAVQALEWQRTPAARELLAEWATGDPSATLTQAARTAGEPVE